jgi:hypothetical protein
MNKQAAQREKRCDVARTDVKIIQVDDMVARKVKTGLVTDGGVKDMINSDLDQRSDMPSAGATKATKRRRASRNP